MSALGIELVLLIVGIFLLIKGSDIFVDSGSAIGKVLKISEILVGMTIVAFGTSMPEFIVGITSAQGSSTDIALRKYTWYKHFQHCGYTCSYFINKARTI